MCLVCKIHSVAILLGTELAKTVALSPTFTYIYFGCNTTQKTKTIITRTHRVTNSLSKTISKRYQLLTSSIHILILVDIVFTISLFQCISGLMVFDRYCIPRTFTSECKTRPVVTHRASSLSPASSVGFYLSFVLLSPELVHPQIQLCRSTAAHQLCY